MLPDNPLRKTIADPTSAISYVRKRSVRTALRIDRQWYQFRYGRRGRNVLEDEWDTLILLDAARADMFREAAPFEDEAIAERYSIASESSTFLTGTFEGRQNHDTVYVTANPYAREVSDDTFHAVYNLLVDEWDPALKTVPPSAVVEAARQARDRHPRKRMVVHFMQPHYPFIGPLGADISAGIGRDGETDEPNPWYEQMFEDGVGRDTLIAAYRENYDVVMPHVVDLLDSLSERVAVSADHANLIGERGFPIPIPIYGHPKRFHHPALLKVPWYVSDGEPLSVEPDPPIERQRLTDEALEDRLAALGYR